MSDDTVDVMRLADLALPWSIRVASTLRLADLVDGGTDDVDALAASTGCDAERLWGVLALLARHGVFEDCGGGRFEMNDAARQLLDEGSRTFLDLDGIGGRFAGVWSTLLPFVRTGDTHYATVFGLPFWEDLDSHPAVREQFDWMMAEGHARSVPPLTGGWDAVRWVIDVGGGKGHVAATILRENPGVRATIVDLPATAERARATLAAAGLSDRADVVGQSFFDPLPAGGDVYMLRGVINDWPDREAITILQRCAEAVAPGGRVLVAGGVRDDDQPPRNGIDKLVTGGRDRRPAAFEQLAAAAGLAVDVCSSGVAECSVARR